MGEGTAGDGLEKLQVRPPGLLRPALAEKLQQLLLLLRGVGHSGAEAPGLFGVPENGAFRVKEGKPQLPEKGIGPGGQGGKLLRRGRAHGEPRPQGNGPGAQLLSRPGGASLEQDHHPLPIEGHPHQGRLRKMGHEPVQLLVREGPEPRQAEGLFRREGNPEFPELLQKAPGIGGLSRQGPPQHVGLQELPVGLGRLLHRLGPGQDAVYPGGEEPEISLAGRFPLRVGVHPAHELPDGPVELPGHRHHEEHGKGNADQHQDHGGPPPGENFPHDGAVGIGPDEEGGIFSAPGIEDEHLVLPGQEGKGAAPVSPVRQPPEEPVIGDVLQEHGRVGMVRYGAVGVHEHHPRRGGGRVQKDLPEPVQGDVHDEGPADSRLRLPDVVKNEGIDGYLAGSLERKAGNGLEPPAVDGPAEQGESPLVPEAVRPVGIHVAGGVHVLPRAVVDIDGMNVHPRAHDGVETPYPRHFVEVFQVPTVHEVLDRRLQEQLHAADADHFLEVFVHPAVFREELPVQPARHGRGELLEMVVEEPGEHQNGDDDRSCQQQEDLGKIGFQYPESDHGSRSGSFLLRRRISVRMHPEIWYHTPLRLQGRWTGCSSSRRPGECFH